MRTSTVALPWQADPDSWRPFVEALHRNAEHALAADPDSRMSLACARVAELSQAELDHYTAGATP